MPRKKGVPFARSDELKKQRSLSLTERAFVGLRRIVERLGFKTLSELLEAIGRGEIFLTRKPLSFDAAIATWDVSQLAAAASIPIERLESIQKGEDPTPDELVGLAWALRMKPSDLHELLRKGNGEHKCNGC